MGCTSCGNGYTGNCSCTDPITLVAKGDKGDTGATGVNGTSGASLLNSVVIPPTTPAIATTPPYTIHTHTIVNSITQKCPQVGDLIRIKGQIRFQITTSYREVGFRITINGTSLFGGTGYYLTGIKPGVTVYHDFDIGVKRVDDTNSGYRSFVSYGEASGFMQETRSKTTVSATNAFNFTQDLIVNVDVMTRDNFTPFLIQDFTSINDATLMDFVIEKYLLP
jgi:hypothetical protein